MLGAEDGGGARRWRARGRGPRGSGRRRRRGRYWASVSAVIVNRFEIQGELTLIFVEGHSATNCAPKGLEEGAETHVDGQFVGESYGVVDGFGGCRVKVESSRTVVTI